MRNAHGFLFYLFSSKLNKAATVLTEASVMVGIILKGLQHKKVIIFT